MSGRINRVDHDRDFTCLSNETLRDERLSWKARGLLAYLLSKPDDWTVMQAELEDAGPDGRSAVRAGLAELEEHGYLTRRRTQITVDGQVSTALETCLWETPRGGNRRSAHRGAETGLYEVPTTNEIRRGRKSPLGGVVQHPLLAAVRDLGNPERDTPAYVECEHVPPPDAFRGPGAVDRLRAASRRAGAPDSREGPGSGEAGTGTGRDSEAATGARP